MCEMSAETWSALGTWAGAIGTVGTLWYMRGQIVQQNKQLKEDKKQYETDRNDRLKSEELDKAYEREREMLRLNDESYRYLYNIPPERMEAILNSPQALEWYKGQFITIARFNEVMAGNIGIFKSKDPIRGEILEFIFLHSLSYELVDYYNDMGASRKLNNTLRASREKK